MEDILVPIFLFMSIVATIWLISHFNFKKRHAVHETLRHAVENGQQVSMDLIEKMSLLVDPVRSDLRRGVLFIAFGLAFLLLGSLISHEEPEAIRPMLGVAAFPIILGLAYHGLWKFGHKRSA